MLRKSSSLLKILACLSLSSQAFAVNPVVGPRIEPGPEVALSDETLEFANILLNSSLKDCVAQFQGQDTTSLSITRQHMNLEETVYKVSALILQGGDMIVGNSQIRIWSKLVPHPFWPELKVRTYDCEYSEQML